MSHNHTIPPISHDKLGRGGGEQTCDTQSPTSACLSNSCIQHTNAHLTLRQLQTANYSTATKPRWLGGSVFRALGRDRTVKVANSTLAGPLPSNNSGQVVHTHVPLSPSSIIWYRPKDGRALEVIFNVMHSINPRFTYLLMLCGWEGNRRSGVTLVMHHRLSGLSTYGLNGHVWEMSTSPKPHWDTAPLPLHSYRCTQE